MSDRRAEEEEKFLTRWSRRKVEARRAEPEEAPAGPPEAAAPAVTSAPGTGPAPAQPQAPLPTIEELRGLQSEYREFLQPGVDETLRRSALKRLFQDPHFNVMDGLDTYIDDYSKEDPIPVAMLKALNQAKGLIFDRDAGQRANESPARPADDAAGEQKQVPAPASPPVSLPPVWSDGDEAGDGDVAKSDASKPGTPG